MKVASLFTAMSLSCAVFAQIPGFHKEPDYVLDDFAQHTEYEHIQWLPQVGAPKTTVADSAATFRTFDEWKGEVFHDTCYPVLGSFSYSTQRDAENFRQLLQVSQPYGYFEPITIAFGEGRTLDLSKGNAYFYLDIKNTSLSNARLLVSLVDVYGKEANSAGSSIGSQIWQDRIAFNLPKEKQVACVANFSVDSAYVGVYEKLGCREWVVKEKDASIDLSKINKVLLTFISSKTNRISYDPVAMQDATFEIYKFRLGDYRTNVVTSLDESSGQSLPITTFPNPSKDRVTFSTALDHVRLVDAFGNTRKVVGRATEMMVNDLPRGIYYLQSDQLKNTKIVVE